jgi:SAM-dependent methyltransferase
MNNKKGASPLLGSIKNYFKTITSPEQGNTAPAAISNIRYKRFLTDNPVAYQSAIEAAETYVSKLADRERAWLFAKPFDPARGNTEFYRLMYDLLNILETMRLPPNAKILEIGSGPGWVTEILLMLGFSVDALEPSSDLIAIAQERCAALAVHYHHPGEPKVRFHQDTLEQIHFEEGSFDAILFFDVLHHVVDENLAVANSFRFLKPGGCLGVVDPSWHPDYKNLETQMIGEMVKFGTLENPFSTEYIDYLLDKAGFIEIERYISVNGMFTREQMTQPLQKFSPRPYAGSNNMTARKPDGDDMRFPSCLDPSARTDAGVTLLSGGIDSATRSAAIRFKLKNTGDTLLDCRPNRSGHITVSLHQGEPGSAEFIECLERYPIAERVIPGAEITMELRFTLPANATLPGWQLDLVSEDAFWFSSRGIKTCPIPVL